MLAKYTSLLRSYRSLRQLCRTVSTAICRVSLLGCASTFLPCACLTNLREFPNSSGSMVHDIVQHYKSKLILQYALAKVACGRQIIQTPMTHTAFPLAGKCIHSTQYVVVQSCTSMIACILGVVSDRIYRYVADYTTHAAQSHRYHLIRSSQNASSKRASPFSSLRAA